APGNDIQLSSRQRGAATHPSLGSWEATMLQRTMRGFLNCARVAADTFRGARRRDRDCPPRKPIRCRRSKSPSLGDANVRHEGGGSMQRGTNGMIAQCLHGPAADSDLHGRLVRVATYKSASAW